MKTHGYLTERQLYDKIDIPVSIPATEVLPGDDIIVSTFQLTTPRQRAVHRVCELLVTARTPESPDNPQKVDSALGYAYVAIFDASGTRVAATETIIAQTGPFNVPATSARLQPAEIAGPSTGVSVYTVRIVNNCADVAIKAVVTGQIRIELNSNPT